ncbi:MAG TPA: hypothetical protein VNM66_06600 [Thermodesulfobacteriota bacterium]|nr:hypothetical protein [Thermodesulfobacteriota bacterium]
MRRLPRPGPAWLALLAAGLLPAGCVTTGPPSQQAALRTLYHLPYRTHPQLAQRSKAIRVAAVVQPDIRIYALSAGGVEELRDDWSAAGRENVIRALKETLAAQGVELRTPAADDDSRETLEELHALFRVVSLSILTHTYPSEHAFLTKVEHFDYSVGPVDRLLQKSRADALILVYGFDQISTGGRKTLQAVGAILPFVGGPRAGLTGLSMALVDRSGTVLWYKIDASEGRHDLRDADSARRFVAGVLTDFPRLGR